jgi:nucleoid DNA-binding protein
MATTTEQSSATTRWGGVLQRIARSLTGREERGVEQESEPDMQTTMSEPAMDIVTEEEVAEIETSEAEAATERDEEAELQALLDLKKKELIDRVVDRLGFKKKDVKPVVEAVLQELGDAVGEGRALNLEPFGKLNINRTDNRPNGRVTVCRLRQSVAKPVQAEEPLAEPAE